MSIEEIRKKKKELEEMRDKIRSPKDFMEVEKYAYVLNDYWTPIKELTLEIGEELAHRSIPLEEHIHLLEELIKRFKRAKQNVERLLEKGKDK